jgi:hypothetical protein
MFIKMLNNYHIPSLTGRQRCLDVIVSTNILSLTGQIYLMLRSCGNIRNHKKGLDATFGNIRKHKKGLDATFGNIRNYKKGLDAAFGTFYNQYKIKNNIFLLYNYNTTILNF